MASKFKREFKNVVLNYSDAEAKVREATSNDPWGPSSALMSELSEYTFHVQAYSLVMGMLWKRLNDSGKNWRHVYKSLIVLEYLIKSGSERVAQQCKENLFSIQTLKDFQYVDKDGKDQGANIREKAKQLVALLKDDNKLKDERVRARQTRERQQAINSQSVNVEFGRSPKSKTRNRVQFDTSPSAPSAGATSPNSEREGHRTEQNVEQARPTDPNEEELQLKLALQLSKQQAEEEDKLRKQEEESLRAAIALSQAESEDKKEEEEEEKEEESGDLLLDLNSSGVVDPWSVPAEPPPSYDAVTGTKAADPWSTYPTTTPQPTQPVPAPDPFAPVTWGITTTTSTTTTPAMDPWAGFSSAPTTTTTQSAADPWSTPITIPPLDPSIAFPPSTSSQLPPTTSPNPFDLSDLGPLPPLQTSSASSKPNRVEDQFLGENALLVDLDSLGALPQPKNTGPSPINPFGTSNSTSSVTQNPFDANKPPAPTLHQLATANKGYNSSDLLPAPLIPVAGGGRTSPVPAQNTQPLPTNNQLFNPFS